MGKHKKKQKKQKDGSSPSEDQETTIVRLRKENAVLRERLARIAELTRAPELRDEEDDEDAEYDELTRDVDDQLSEEAPSVPPKQGSV